MARDSITLKELDESGHDIRAWCFDCARGAVIDSIMWQRFEARGWPMELELAAARFPCRKCRSSEHVRLFPASRPQTPHNAPALLVEAFFHGMRSIGKRSKGGTIGQAAARQVIDAHARRIAPKPKLPVRPPPDLRLVWSRDR